MKKIIWLCSAALLASCVTPGAAMKQAKTLDYGAKPATSLVLTQMDAKIRPHLKDPSSLKNLNIVSSFKCYASKMGMSDNVSPKYKRGYWCYTFAYQATNSYGGYVTGSANGVYADGRMQTVDQLDETVRKHDDIYTYWQPTFR